MKTKYPAITVSSRVPKRPKVLFVDVNSPARDINKRPEGFLPLNCEDRGRYNEGGTEKNFFDDYEPNNPTNGELRKYDASRVRDAAKSFATVPFVMDEERSTFSTDSRKVAQEQAEDNKRWYRGLLKEYKLGNPLSMRGIYGELPYTDYWVLYRQWRAEQVHKKWLRKEPLNDFDKWEITHAYRWVPERSDFVLDDATEASGEGRKDFLLWQKANDADCVGRYANGKVNPSGGKLQVVDALFPTLYTFYKGDFNAGVAEMLGREAKRIGRGRPSYPFLWADYHNASEFPGQLVDLEDWRSQAKAVFAHHDGCVLWGYDHARHQTHANVLREEAAAAMLAS